MTSDYSNGNTDPPQGYTVNTEPMAMTDEDSETR